MRRVQQAPHAGVFPRVDHLEGLGDVAGWIDRPEIRVGGSLRKDGDHVLGKRLDDRLGTLVPGVALHGAADLVVLLAFPPADVVAVQLEQHVGLAGGLEAVWDQYDRPPVAFFVRVAVHPAVVMVGVGILVRIRLLVADAQPVHGVAVDAVDQRRVRALVLGLGIRPANRALDDRRVAREQGGDAGIADRPLHFEHALLERAHAR